MIIYYDIKFPDVTEESYSLSVPEGVPPSEALRLAAKDFFQYHGGDQHLTDDYWWIMIDDTSDVVVEGYVEVKLEPNFVVKEVIKYKL